MADLAAEFAAGIGAISKGADRLERQGLVVRQPNPLDRRSSLLTLTDDGLRLVNAADGTFTERLTELIAEVLKAHPITGTAQLLSELRSVLERDQIGTPTG
ncbi:MarR family winged helix-turn-helix transcriptional regulator [Rugosimonospora acidiphila]|uniref:MarR family winged helix-turn-helix transcriptional regulator n=1 Tax=Rugosimonospora acidiphila TaxID=556531 RepID=UPI003CD094AE